MKLAYFAVHPPIALRGLIAISIIEGVYNQTTATWQSGSRTAQRTKTQSE